MPGRTRTVGDGGRMGESVVSVVGSEEVGGLPCNLLQAKGTKDRPRLWGGDPAE